MEIFGLPAEPEIILRATKVADIPQTPSIHNKAGSWGSGTGSNSQQMKKSKAFKVKKQFLVYKCGREESCCSRHTF